MPVGWGAAASGRTRAQGAMCGLRGNGGNNNKNNVQHACKDERWEGPTSRGYKWAQDLLVQATTLNIGESGTASDEGGARRDQEQGQEQRQEWPHLQLQIDFNRAYGT